jgi:type I restriction enzyme, S subunit
MSELPENWVSVAIGEVCNLMNGRAFKPTEWTTSGLPIVRIQNLNNPNASYNYFAGTFENRYHLWGGELLFAWSGTPGTSFGAHVWRGEEAVLNQHIFRVDFDENELDKRFFRYAINEKLNELIGIAHGGVGLRHVTKGKFEGTEISLPPLNEQKRIADKLEQLLERVTSSLARLETAESVLKRFRQSVLAAATSGKLTEDWREENEISSEWEIDIVGNLIVEKPRNGYSPKSVEYETKTKSLTLTATTSGYFNPKHHKYLDEEIPSNSHLWLEPNDILIQRSNSLEYVGVSAIYNGKSKEFIYPDIMIKVQANSRIETQFLYFLLRSDLVRKYFRENATGTAGNMPKINQQTVINAPAIVPSLPEQLEIVRRVEILFGFADQLGTRIQTARTALERLTPSILAKAFRGQLVPQDPTDEPASVLLERIQTAKNANLNARETKKAPRIAKPERVQTGTLEPKKRGRPSSIKVARNTATMTETHLTDLLRARGEGSTRMEELWQESQLDFAAFFAQLKTESERGLIKEIKDLERGLTLLEVI